MLIESRPWLCGAVMSVSDCTVDTLLDPTRLGLANDSREIGQSIRALIPGLIPSNSRKS